MNSERAETIALQALGWLAGNDDLFPTFLGATGAAVSDLRDRAADPAFLASVLEFITMDDQWVVAFCGEAGLANEDPMRARYALPGQGQVHWT